MLPRGLGLDAPSQALAPRDEGAPPGRRSAAYLRRWGQARVGARSARPAPGGATLPARRMGPPLVGRFEARDRGAAA